jgi:type IV pilus assembly protein PilZ
VGEGPARAAIAKNLSIGGAFIQTDDPAPFGAAITVVIRLPGLGTASIPSTVRWCKESGMGVQFGAMGARETHGLTELLRVGAD